MKISIIGIGRLGLCLALCFEKAGYEVLGMDLRENYVNELNNKTFKTSEPKVNEYLENSTKFYATTSLENTLNYSDKIYILVDTPNGGGDNFYDHSKLSNLLSTINNYKIKNKTIIICCTVIPGYCKNISYSLLDKCEEITIAYSPEFIAQGNIINGLINPDVILMGCENKIKGNELIEIYKKICYNDNNPSILLGLLEAEITKISVNGFITTKISYANMIGDACVNSGADPKSVLEAIGMDSRIGNKYFKYGYSFGGPCFPRDTRALSLWINNQGVSPIISESAGKYNNYHIYFQAEKLLLENKDEYIIEDIAFKSNTNVPIIEESAKLKIAKYLVKKGKRVIIKDNSINLLEVKKEYGNMFIYQKKDV